MGHQAVAKAEWKRCIGQRIGQRYWHDFVIKDVTAKQLETSHIECNRYGRNQYCRFTSCTQNILRQHGHTLDVFLATVSSLVKNRLSKTAPDIDDRRFKSSTLYEFDCGRHHAA